jgi:hypothetical protein
MHQNKNKKKGGRGFRGKTDFSKRSEKLGIMEPERRMCVCFVCGFETSEVWRLQRHFDAEHQGAGLDHSRCPHCPEAGEMPASQVLAHYCLHFRWRQKDLEMLQRRGRRICWRGGGGD